MKETSIKNFLISASAVALGVVVFIVVRNILNKRFGSLISEPMANASGIQCMCEDKWGNIRPQNCRTRYANCEDCCGHYGKEMVSGW